MNNIITTPFVTLMHDGKYVTPSLLSEGIIYSETPYFYKENSAKQDIITFESSVCEYLELPEVNETFKANLELCELVVVVINKKGKVVYTVDDAKLLRTYMLGFNDGLYGENFKLFNIEVLAKAYQIGHADALIGDDVMSSDYESNESILKRIKN